MVDVALMNPNRIEYPLGQFAQMNVLMWNYRGELKPDFKRRIFEMVVNHNMAIMVIMKTRMGGDRAERIIANLPFDGFITTKTTDYARGLWVLWKKDEAEIELLASTEQEIHATIKLDNVSIQEISRERK
ncbi:uncharacterized protein LOC115984297 [Quercus lobata]|uniref:uncharacterized protein LOC115984297 n=1 Tax=Quercus lobata TaxID=97700 RepID=UPI00124426EB|nr:uncharacterized protein LOC115984297 [Quercus lobata]